MPSLGWSGGAEVDRSQALSAISCPSLGLCVAVDSAGRATVSTHPTGGAGAWSEPFAIGGAAGFSSVSCASSSLCVAVGGEGEAALSTQPSLAGAGSWSEAFTIKGAKGLAAVSCASSSLCVAVDGAGQAILSTHPAVAGAGSWSEPFAIGGVKGLTSVSCASSSLCATVDGEGHVAISTEPAAGASAWHVRAIDPGLGFVAVSCFGAGSCVAVDGAGGVFASSDAAASFGAGGAPGSGATWSATAFDAFGAPSALACALTGVCVAADGTGYAFASDDPTAAPPAWPSSGIDTVPFARALRGVSCVAEGETLCAAVDAGGRVFTATLPAPPAPVGEASLVQPHPAISGIPAPGQVLTCRPGVAASGSNASGSNASGGNASVGNPSGGNAGGVSLGYAWLRDTRAIAGASGAAYFVGEGDVSHHLQCRVTATTAAGSLSANSAFVTVPAGGLGTISETAIGTPRAGRYGVSVSLICSAQAAGRCSIVLRLSVLETLRGNRVVALAAARGGLGATSASRGALTRRITLTVGALALRLRPGQRYMATVALNATGRALLAHAHRLAVRLTVSGTVVGALSASLKSATLVLGVPKKIPAKKAHARGGGATPVSVLAPTPYMGWDTYFAFGGHYDEGSVLAQASELLTRGLARAGYDYVWLDAGWWQGARGAHGEIVVDPAQWPHGMAWLAGTLHAAGLRVGIYTDAGSVGCGGPGQGSFGHYQQDVNTFAAWGFDAVKVDFCGGVRQGLVPSAAYSAFHAAIVHNASRRALLLSICDFLQPGQFAAEDPSFEGSAFAAYTFGPSSGTSWRTNTDIGVPGNVRFGDVLTNLDADAAQPQAAAPGHWNDPDYLGPDQGMSGAQFRAQFSMWAVLAAPLMISADLISLSHGSLATVSNREAIAIDQDPAGVQGRLLASSGEGQIWVKPLSDGSRAIAFLNRGSGTVRLATTAVAVGMPGASGYAVRNVWTGGVAGAGAGGAISASVPGGSVVLLRVTAR
jgi:Alpha galactosidase A/Alpha galactosidase C-terminal beta sandwich domain